MAALPRAICPVCKRSVALRSNGKLREHRTHPWSSELCRASGYRPGCWAAQRGEANR